MATKTFARIRFVIGLLSVTSCLGLVGCGGGNAPSEPTAQSATPNNSSQTTTEPSSNAQQSTAAISPKPVVVDGAETEAAQCVAVFLDSMRRGDEKAANSVLTQKAREELAKTDYVLRPFGTPQGQYEIGRVGFPYEEKSVALVECSWKEPAAQGEQPVELDIVCEVRRSEAGWAISGMGVTLTGTEETLVLDFEDAASIQATNEAAGGSTKTQTVSNTPANGQAQPQLPGLPPPPGAQSPQQQPANQIAMPPGGVNRY